jgi:transposase, IS30 family
MTGSRSLTGWRGEPVKVIAARIGKSYRTLYREIARNNKPSGRYQPWYAHGQAHLRRPRARMFEHDAGLAGVAAGRLERRWSPDQISRWLRCRSPSKLDWHVCAETIYGAVYRGLIVPAIAHRPQLPGPPRTRPQPGRCPDAVHRDEADPAASRDRRVPPAGRALGRRLIIGAGQRSPIATLVERKTRYAMLVPLPCGHAAASVAEALIEAFTALSAGLRHADLGPGQRDVPARPYRAGNRAEDLLRRSALALAARRQRNRH